MEARQQRFMYDDRLSPMCRIFLAEISKYYGTPVDCYNDDVFFATIFKVSTRQVKRWKEEGKKFGYLTYGKSETGRRTISYVPDVQNHVSEHGEMRIVYKTPNGQFITNTLEALEYYNSYIDSFQQFPEKLKGQLRIFCHTFANSLFNEKIINLRMESSGAILTTEFLQYVVERFNFRIAWRTIQGVIKHYTEIDNLDLYVLASLSRIYWTEYQIAIETPEYKQKKKLLFDEVEKFLKNGG